MNERDSGGPERSENEQMLFSRPWPMAFPKGTLDAQLNSHISYSTMVTGLRDRDVGEGVLAFV